MKSSGSKLQEEIKQKRPFVSRKQEAFLAVLRTADVLRRRVAQVIEPSGLSMEQYNVLRILRGSHPERLPVLEVAARLIEQSPAITRLMDKLEQKGYILRDRCKEDRRQVLCRITDEGLAVLQFLDGPVTSASAAGLDQLRDEDLARLVHYLDTIRNQ